MNKSDYFRLRGKFSRQVYDGDVRRSWVHVYPLDAQAVRQYGKVCRRARQRRGEDLVVGFAPNCNAPTPAAKLDRTTTAPA